MHARKTDCPCLPSHGNDGKCNIKSYVKYLAEPEHQVFMIVHLLQLCTEDAAFEVLGKVHDEHPGKRRNSVNKYHIYMLYAMQWNPFLRCALADDRTFGNVIVYAIYISISMMNDIMLEFPDEGISSEGIKG